MNAAPNSPSTVTAIHAGLVPNPHLHARKALRHIWLHPRAALNDLAVSNAWSWLAPIGIALLVFYARIFTLAYLRDPFLYRALVAGALTILVGWPLCAALLYALAASTSSRPGFQSLLVLCAWATLPLTLRSALQVVYMVATGQLVAHPGLAGLLAGMDASDWSVRAGQLVLGRLDLFLLWHLALLALAVSVGCRVSLAKALFLVALYAALILLFASSAVLG